MGMDVYGENNDTYFRNNVWWWRPLWNYICDSCGDILTVDDAQGGYFNDGYLIEETKALAIAKRIKRLHKEGKIKEYAEEYKDRLEKMKDEKCDICKGTGKRDDIPELKGICNACEGKGKRRPWATNYPFSVQNVLDFADFCKKSGGFRIS